MIRPKALLTGEGLSKAQTREFMENVSASTVTFLLQAFSPLRSQRFLDVAHMFTRWNFRGRPKGQTPHWQHCTGQAWRHTPVFTGLLP